MKSAEEWYAKMPEIDDCPPTFNRGNYISWIKAIQANAHKQGVIDGLKRAAEVVSNTPLGYVTERDHEVTEVYSDRCEAALLTLATKIESGEVEV